MKHIIFAIWIIISCCSQMLLPSAANAQASGERTYVDPARIRQARALLDKIIDAYKIDEFASDLAVIIENVSLPVALNLIEEEAKRRSDQKTLRQVNAVRQYGARLASEVKAIVSLQRTAFLNDLAYTLAMDFQEQELQSAEAFLLSEGMRRQAEALRGVIKTLLILNAADVEQAIAYGKSPEAGGLARKLDSPRMQKLLQKWYVIVVSSISPEIRDMLEIPDGLR